MAPGFFSKLVKSPPNGQHSRERSSDRSFDSHRSPSPTSIPISPRSRTISTPNSTVGSKLSSSSSLVKGLPGPNHENAPTINVPQDGSDSTQPTVMVVPPSPMSSTHSEVDEDGRSIRSNRSRSQSSPARPRNGKGDAPAVPPMPDGLPAPAYMTGTSSQPNSRPSSRASSKLRETLTADSGKDTRSLRNKSSSKSLKSHTPPPIDTAHTRAATTPALERSNSDDSNHSDLVESPVALLTPPIGGDASSNGKLSTPAKEADVTPSKDKAKKQPAANKWRNPKSKPTGLASAIAASGLAMANPHLTPQQQAAHQAQLSPPIAQNRKASQPSPPYLNGMGSGSAVSTSTSSHTRMGSSDFSPKANKGKKRGAASVNSDHSDFYDGQALGTVDYYSGLEDETSDDEDDSDTGDVLNDLDLANTEMPVTGFAVANSRRNADFHELFPTIPEGDYLIEDYGCAMQREILIQGRIYISENHICFHANIFGWITDLSIPIFEITSLEKKMTAFVIPNAIQLTTRQNKYSFTSFLSRDTTFDVIYNIWRLARPDANLLGSAPASAVPSTDHVVETSGPDGATSGTMQTRTTQCACGKNGKHYPEKALEMVVPGTPEKIYSLLFSSGFMKEFMTEDQKLFDIQASDWAPIEPGSKLLARNMSYIKPLYASMGPKQTKCEIRDETEYCDFDDYVSTVTTTKNPDVPSGNVFSCKTRTCIMWASLMSTRVIVTTQVEWTGRSFIKGIIDRSAIEGQKTYHKELEAAVRKYINEHQTEFLPEGVDATALEPEPTTSDQVAETPSQDEKQREHERNQRAYQWAWDTLDGAVSLAKTSGETAWDLISDAWDQSSSTTILYFVIAFLVLSNLYTLSKMGKQQDMGRREALKVTGDREKWIHGVVTALWDELSAGQGPLYFEGVPRASSEQHGAPDPLRIQKELASMAQALETMENRVKTLKAELGSVMSDLD